MNPEIWNVIRLKRATSKYLISCFVILFVTQQDLAAIKKQVDAISNTAEKLLELIPDAREHIEPKLEELQYTWINLKERAALRLERLHQMEDVQIYFDDYRGLWWVGVEKRR